MLAACAHFPTHESHSSPIGYTSKGNSLLAYANQISGYSDDKLQAQLEKARRKFSNQPDAYDRLKLVLLLMTPGTAITNYSEAQSLLASYVSRKPQTVQDKTLAPLARYLLNSVNTRRQVLQALTSERQKRRNLEQEIKKVTAVEGGAQHLRKQTAH